MLIDAYEVAHWMNVRKVTPNQVAERANLTEAVLLDLLAGARRALPDHLTARLAQTLRVAPEQLAGREGHELRVSTVTAAEFRASRRPIQRDGIHFYDYYSMAGPPGSVAPVVLDIHCPADRLPALNNGHLEPAITVNLGPGDINGRWGEELGEATWQVLEANHDMHGWITGDSYVEPSYCPHAYSLASPSPARIVSYTAESHLAPLVRALNDWPDEEFAALLERIGDASPAALLRAELERRCHTAASAASAARVGEDAINAFLGGDPDALNANERERIAATLGFDHRMLIAPPRQHDAVGKTCWTVADSRASMRTFAGYAVASTAAAPHLSDLAGQFMHVKRADGERLDLCSTLDTHYLVLAGDLTLGWSDGDDVSSVALGADGSAWIAPCVRHGWTGEGAVLRLGSGRHLSYLDALELTNTFAPAATLRRGRRAVRGWGYDCPGESG